MPINQDLLNQINTALGATVTSSLTTSSKTCDLYEAYILCLVLQAARNEGGSISFYDANGLNPATFIFRTSPGTIGLKQPAYCYAQIRFPNKPTLEAHLGIYVRGKSKVRHEADVAVLRHAEATTCRQHDLDPRHSKIVIAAECKMYLTSTLGVGLGRSFLGLTLDFRGVKSTFIANKHATSIEKLLVAHNRSKGLDVVPSQPARVNQLVVYFQTVFQDFKAKN